MDAAVEGANTAKLAGSRRQVLAAQRQLHVGKQQQYDSDLQVCAHTTIRLAIKHCLAWHWYYESIEHVKNGCMHYQHCCFFTVILFNGLLLAQMRKVLCFEAEQHKSAPHTSVPVDVHVSHTQVATEQADKASAALLSQRQARATAQRQAEQHQRAMWRERSYKLSTGSSAISSMQACLQALATGSDSCADSGRDCGR